jgi:hypothetical protein
LYSDSQKQNWHWQNPHANENKGLANHQLIIRKLMENSECTDGYPNRKLHIYSWQHILAKNENEKSQGKQIRKNIISLCPKYVALKYNSCWCFSSIHPIKLVIFNVRCLIASSRIYRIVSLSLFNKNDDSKGHQLANGYLPNLV